jgi:hypothetical protein
MDGTRFDQMTRALAHRASRRRAAKLLAGGTAGALAVSWGGDVRKGDLALDAAAQVDLCSSCKTLCEESISEGCDQGLGALAQRFRRCKGGSWQWKLLCNTAVSTLCLGAGAVTSSTCPSVCKSVTACAPTSSASSDTVCTTGWCGNGTCRPEGGCCPDDLICSNGVNCCPPNYPVCCVGLGADGSTFCCPSNYVCDATYGCVPQFVEQPSSGCPADYPIAHPTLPAPAGFEEGWSLCCPAEYPGGCVDRFGNGYCVLSAEQGGLCTR